MIDKRKIYIFEFKNTFFSGAVKYSYDFEQIQEELDKKFIQNNQGKPKGITQLANVIEDIYNGKYQEIIIHEPSSYIIYPIIITTDFTFVIPVIYQLLLNKFKAVIKNRPILKDNSQIKNITLIDFDLLLKFQDLFITKKITLNHALNDYQEYLFRQKNPIDKSISFHKYLHIKTAAFEYGSPKMFMEEIKNSLF